MIKLLRVSNIRTAFWKIEYKKYDAMRQMSVFRDDQTPYSDYIETAKQNLIEVDTHSPMVPKLASNIIV